MAESGEGEYCVGEYGSQIGHRSQMGQIEGSAYLTILTDMTYMTPLTHLTSMTKKS